MNRFKMVTKRALSIFLCMVMLLTVMFSVPLSVNAETAEIQAEPKVEVVENNDENISCDTTVENKEQTINIVKEEKADISDIGTDTVNEFEVDGIKYADIDDVSVKVIGYNKELLPEDLVIPETVEGKTVTEIGERAFFKTNIKSVIVPQTVTTIGQSAFSTILSLTSATILGNITEISNGVFYYCPHLSEVSLPDSIKHIGDEAFGTCRLENFQLPKNLETIGSYAFRGCGMTQLTIPASLHTIGNHGFDGLYNLTKVIFEERTTLLSLGEYAFSSCKKITSFDLTNCSKLGAYAFQGCIGFTSMTLPENVDISTGYGAFYGCTNLKTVTLSENMTAIPSAFFYGCTKLQSIQGSDITSIGGKAFFACKSITEYNFPYCTSIGSEAFFSCHGLTNVVFPDNIDISLGNGVFSECSYLKSITLPRNMTEIPDEFFYNCHSLESIQGNKMTSVGKEAFTNCRKLTSFDFSYCTNIGSSAFSNCKGLTDVAFPENIDVTIGSSAFSGCTNLKTVKLPDSTDAIVSSCFSDCSSLETVQGGKITRVGNSAFINCSSLLNFDFANCTAVNSSAFSGCTSLQGVQANKIEKIWDKAFENCSSIESFDFSFCTSIGDSAFKGCAGLAAVTLPENIIIGDSVFSGCTGMKTAKLPDSMDTIPDSCFRDCTSLESIETGEIKVVKNAAFYNCNNLANASFAKDNSITTVDEKAFENCYMLTEFALHKVKYIYASAFENCTSLINVDLEKNTTLVSIKSEAFYNCFSLEEINIPSSCERINDNAFQNCYNLKSVDIQDGLLSVGEFAFYNCLSLPEIYIPESVKEIGGCAFGCFDYNDEIYSFSDFVVVGSPDSLAQEYAEAYGVTYEYGLPAPTLSSITNTTDGIKISFEKLSGVSGKYRVYRKTDGTSWTKLADITSDTYTDKTAESGVYYTYTVKFIGNDGINSRYDKQGITIMRIANPAVTSIKNTEEGAKITWDKVDGATVYRVYYKTSSDWVSLGDTRETSFTHTGIDSNSTYTYTLRAYYPEGYSSFNSKGWTNTFIATPYITKAEVTNNGIKLNWDKVDGASSYRVFINNGTSWKGLATVSGNSYVDKTATAGESYTYTIRALDSNGNFVSDYDKEGFVVRYFETPQITGFENIDDGTVITWNGVEGAEKYRLYVKKDGSWKMLADVEGTSYTHLDLVEGTEYTYTIRCVSEDSKIFESGFDSAGFSNIYEKPEITVLIGDADLDGELSVLDASLIQMYLVGKKTLEGDALIAADADEDGEISVMDASLIQMILVGKK